MDAAGGQMLLVFWGQERKGGKQKMFHEDNSGGSRMLSIHILYIKQIFYADILCKVAIELRIKSFF